MEENKRDQNRRDKETLKKKKNETKTKKIEFLRELFW